MGRNDSLWKPDFSSSQIRRGRGATTTTGTASARTAGKATVTVEEFGIPPWICFGRRSPQCLPRKLWKASQRLEIPGRAGYRGKIDRKWEWYLKARELGYSPNTCAYVYIYINMVKYGMMLGKGNYPQIILFQACELFSFLQGSPQGAVGKLISSLSFIPARF